MDQCLVQPSLEKLPLAVERNKDRDPQPDNVQKAGDLRILSPKWGISIKSSQASEKQKQKDCKTRGGWRSPKN